MADGTGISWTDATWNPIRGCSRVSEGCRHCYAERVASRFCGPGQPYEGLVRLRQRNPGADPKPIGWNGEVRMVPEHLADPLRWRKPRRIFVNSMSDLFHESLSNEQIAAVFGVMAAAPQHTFQVLTKRAKRMREWFEWVAADIRESADEIAPLSPYAANEIGDGSDEDQERWNDRVGNLTMDAWATTGKDGGTVCRMPWPLPNVWLGVSVENQEAADERIPELLATPAAVRFLSCEPLLGPVDLVGKERVSMWTGGDWLRSFVIRDERDGIDSTTASRPALSWVIAGCESGPGARPCDVAWLRSLRDQCESAGVPFFLKQGEGRQSNGIGGTRHIVPIEAARDRSGGAIRFGIGSKRKSGGVIELPYLDGVQHAAFPDVSP